MALSTWQIDDGTKRTMWQNPTSIPFYTWPIAPSWRVIPGGQLNQVLTANGVATTVGPQFLFQGLRMYDGPTTWIPNYNYKEEPYSYVLPINFVAATVNAPGFILQNLNLPLNNYAFKLKRISVSWRQGPTNTAPAQTLGMRIYDWQNRILMSDYVPANVIGFNARNATGSFIYGPHASFPAHPLVYPVQGRIQIDLTDLNVPAAGSVSDIQGAILFEGVNMVPCDSSTPGAKRPNDGGIDLYSGKRVFPLPYFYTPSCFNFPSNKLTFTNSAKFALALDGDSEFWMTAVHNIKTAPVVPPS